MEDTHRRLLRITPEDVFRRLAFAETNYAGVRCLVYTGKTDRAGYARMAIDGKLFLVHRWVYERWVGDIPHGLVLDHLCRVRRCANPMHLEPVTQAENVRRGETGRNNLDKTECPYGHAYDEANTYYYAGSRFCRACHKQRSSEYLRKKRMAQK